MTDKRQFQHLASERSSNVARSSATRMSRSIEDAQLTEEQRKQDNDFEEDEQAI